MIVRMDIHEKTLDSGGILHLDLVCTRILGERWLYLEVDTAKHVVFSLVQQIHVAVDVARLFIM